MLNGMGGWVGGWVGGRAIDLPTCIWLLSRLMSSSDKRGARMASWMESFSRKASSIN